jgi:GTP cyclohydrolase I
MNRPQDIENIIADLIVNLVPDSQREGLKETPKRVCKAWQHWTSGYGVEVAKVFKQFEDGGEAYDEMICQHGIPFHSHCEHHLAPFFGTASIAYIPDGKIVGLSKISRLVDVFAHRLQVQERITKQIADAMQEHLNPKGVGVFLSARHFCMESRGICRSGIETTTMALRGVFKSSPQTREEFLSGIRKP